ncbi:MAG: dUTP diphosphatase [Eubacteriaceae bacterium]|nr:dUTP diphosphatase [Eubacteriaceae bacterium]
MLKIYIKYFSDDVKRLEFVAGRSDWYDLAASETVELKAGDFALIPLGVAMKLPEGYEAHIVPRSSTFKNFGLLQSNGIGIVDNSYCGDNDLWRMPVYATRDTVVEKGDRIAQFRLMKNQPEAEFIEVEELGTPDRGGFGSTGRK